MGLRKDYFKDCYILLTDAKKDSLGKIMKLRDLLDLWWNSVRIDGNICYKNSYEEDDKYELDNLAKTDLDRKVLVKNWWDEDGDGYPIVYASFIDEKEEE